MVCEYSNRRLTQLGSTKQRQDEIRTSGVLGVHIISHSGGALTSTLLLGELLLLGVRVHLLGLSGVLGSERVGNLGGLLTSTLQRR